jgi:hypothetical protein
LKQNKLNLPMIIVQHLTRDGTITFDAAIWASPKNVADGNTKITWPLHIVREVRLRRDGSTRTAVHIRPEKEE